MKTVIEIARSAGGKPQQNKNCDVEYLISAEALERFAELVRADAIAEEREACAQVAENCFEGAGKHKLVIMAVEAAKAIRARGNA